MILPAFASTLMVCFSHLRWNFVYQRPQHLMSRFASVMPVLYWEEPEPNEALRRPHLRLTRVAPGLTVATPQVPSGLSGVQLADTLRRLLDEHLGAGRDLIRWYYTPIMLSFSGHRDSRCTIYDCMDELANFRFAPPDLLAWERRLLTEADAVFTGGFSLYEAKRTKHHNVHPFPSSVDRAHFAQAREGSTEPPDQAVLGRPRLGYYGVIDERIDLALVAKLADARRDWTVVMVGPTAKIDACDLPRAENLHYLGQKDYTELPHYLRGWDVALMPFAINDATRFISPTKTPEYLAGGKPVVSTPITDVVRHYGDLDAVAVAADPQQFIAACDRFAGVALDADTRSRIDRALGAMSWDQTFTGMLSSIGACARPARPRKPAGAITPATRPVRRQAYDYLIVGAGFAGSVLAERLATQLNKSVLVVDRRGHVGGNAFDERNDAGILMHRYGPHIFHTNSADVFEYLSRFTPWRPYEHRVLASTAGLEVPLPINRTTLNMLFGLNLGTEAEAESFLAGRAEPVATIRTSEDVVVAKVGRELYERFFRGYTRKQWGLDPSELDKSVTQRIPTRTDTDDRYFTDRFQAMPADGYTRLFETMLDDRRITLALGVDYADVADSILYDHLIFTGPIDDYFGHRFGKLPYRSLRFHHLTLDQERFQRVGTVNYPAESVPYTRITEYKHLTGQVHAKTTVTYEYPESEGEPFYPVPRPENQVVFRKYEALAASLRDVTFVGRLANYRYYNMDQVVGQALATFRRLADTQRTRPIERSAMAEA